MTLHLVIWSLYCEAVDPLLLKQGVADPLDVLAYCIGGYLSWALWNWPRYKALSFDEARRETTFGPGAITPKSVIGPSVQHVI